MIIAKSMELTETDRCILSSYKSMTDGLSEYLGAGYEIVLHSLDDLDNSVVRIHNGQYTGRKEGAPITDFALEALEQFDNSQNDISSFLYFTKNKQGAPMKSTTIAIHGENGRIIGLLCINFYMNLPLSTFLRENCFPENPTGLSETFAENADEIIVKTVQQIRNEVFSNKKIPLSNKNKEIISLLRSRGIFNLKDAVPAVADQLGISKNTVYLHLRNSSEPSQQ